MGSEFGIPRITPRKDRNGSSSGRRRLGGAEMMFIDVWKMCLAGFEIDDLSGFCVNTHTHIYIYHIYRSYIYIINIYIIYIYIT